MCRIDARIDDRNGDPLAGESRKIVETDPQLIGANGFGRYRVRTHRRVAGEMIEPVVLLKRRQLTGVHLDDRAALVKVSLDDDVVLRRRPVDGRLVSVDDHLNRLLAAGEVVRQIGAQSRAVCRLRRRAGPQHRHGECVSRPSRRRDERSGHHECLHGIDQNAGRRIACDSLLKGRLSGSWHR